MHTMSGKNPSHAASGVALRKPRILVVEDEAIVARDIHHQLLDLGYDPVGHATTGEEAIALSAELQPDLVLMDIQLGGSMDGVAAAEAIRAQFDQPIVFLTAYGADETLQRVRRAEPFGYVLKPFSERELHTTLDLALYKHQADAKLREAAQHTEAILDHMFDGVITIDSNGTIESFNRAASTLFGYAAQEAIGKNVSMLMPPVYHDQHNEHLQRYAQTGEPKDLSAPREVEGLDSEGHVFPMSLSVSKLESKGKLTFIGMIRDTTQHHLDVEEIRRLAFYDPLTGLANRRLLMDRLKQAIVTSARSGQHGALMLLDLDHFKVLNDSLGHDIGDVLLQQVAARLLACVRQGDSVARLGGDEFVVLLEALSPGANDAGTQAEAVATKILEALGAPYAVRSHTCQSTPSIGIVLFMDEHATLEDLLKRADAAMYQAKSAGRNTVRFFDPAMQAAVAAHAEFERDMRNALRQQEFVLFYQIQVNEAGVTTGAEALVRWQNPQRGMVSPAHFIPMAEETGLILPLGQWVLETACTQLVAWAQSPATAAWTMAVNVSALQFNQADFVANVQLALRKTGADPQLLKLELTESMLADNVDDIIVKMKTLRAIGVTFSLDDFGTGYSSLTYLKRLPLDQLKIDQSFVRDVLTDPSDAVIARTILALGHSLGLRVIAEGVETLDQRDFLVSIGCDAFQGYYFGRPGPVATEYLSKTGL
jgi:diguanylate cyclase (GGDEF)-like protein/PAS domain S-box-containing protein